ncbi:rhodanese-like domain-containing protein [Flavobacteriaceae bacterium]|nr:rhodanese-like domain-containing protein [Flavobacteriaceae bacterium]
MKKHILILFISCTQNTSFIKVVNKEAYLELIKQNHQIIDVRTPNEFENGHIENAVNIDFKAADFIENISALNKNKTLLIYCRSGNRSGKAAKIMDSLGFTKIYDLEGGFMNW